MLAQGRPQRDENHPGAKLRDAEVASVQKAPGSPVAQLFDLGLELFPEIVKDCIHKSPDVFNHDGLRPDDPDYLKGTREQVAFVIPAKLFASLRERRAGKAGRNQIGVSIWLWIPLIQV
jgi:hypothetical protein